MNPDEIQKSLPSNIAEAVSGGIWRENNVGFSSVKVFRIETEASFYLKINSRASKLSLYDEKLRLEWLENLLPVPKAVMFAADETNEYLLMTEIAGVDASGDSLKTDIPGVVEQVTKGLKTIHAVPFENCPFDARLDYKIEAARQRMINNLVEEEDFDAERLGRTAVDVFEEMISLKPSGEDLVFTHGDYCLPNVIIENGVLSGFVDLAQAGVADRFQDLALLSRSVKYNFGAQYEEKVFELYGIRPDREKIHFYRLLDEFF